VAFNHARHHGQCNIHPVGQAFELPTFPLWDNHL